MKRPIPILAAICIHALWIPAGLFNVVRFGAAGKTADAAMSAFATLLDLAALYGLIRRKPWGRFFSAWFLGGIAVLGSIALLVLALQGQPMTRFWLFAAIFIVFGWIAIALLFTKPARDYFGRQGDQPEQGRGAA